MRLTDQQLHNYDDRVLKISRDDRRAHLDQVDHLIERLEKKVHENTAFKIKRFVKAGSLKKGTVLRPRDGLAVDADIVAEMDVREASKEDVDGMHEILRDLLVAMYPQKNREEFTVQPRTLGIEFITSGLCVDLVPVVPIPDEPGYAWQPSSRGEPPIKTNVSGQLTFLKTRRDADKRYRPLVRLLKRWRNRQEIFALGSYSIELLAAYIQDDQGPAPTLEEGLTRFFHFIADSKLQQKLAFPENGKVITFPKDPVVILDPVNRENNVTRRITDEERQEVIKAATAAWESLWTASHNDYDGETFALWKGVFGTPFYTEKANS